MKTIAKALGLSEDATDAEIAVAAAKLNLAVEDGKLVNRSKASNDDDEDDDDDDDDKAKSKSKNEDGPSRKEHDKLKNRCEDLHNRVTKLEATVNKMKNSITTDKVGEKIKALVAAGKIENKQESIDKVKKQFEANFEVAAEIYDALPAKTPAKKTPRLNTVINRAKATAGEATAVKDAEKEHEENAPEVELEEGIETDEEGNVYVMDEKGNPVLNTGVAVVDGKVVKAPKVRLSDARKELTATEGK